MGVSSRQALTMGSGVFMASRSSEENASSMHIKSACNARPEGNQWPGVMSDYTPMLAVQMQTEKGRETIDWRPGLSLHLQ